MNTNTINTIKNRIKEHQAVIFAASDINCENNRVNIGSNYHVPVRGVDRMMETVGIRKNLKDDIFKKPVENWPAFRNALDAVDKKKRFGAIVDKDGRVVTLLRTAPGEFEQLNYDDRIDQVINAIDTSRQSLQNIFFNPEKATLTMNITNHKQVETGLENDLWQFGSTVDLGYVGNQFNQYFLRLICTNGMTTRENLTYRQVARTNDVGRQFINFSKDESFATSIMPRVQLLKNTRASFAEVKGIADTLTKDQVDEFMPWYRDIIRDHNNRGVNLEDMSAKRHRFVYTNENSYDVFNLATFLATHRADEIGRDVSLSLNKRASEMFAKGPNLAMSTIDIYNN